MVWLSVLVLSAIVRQAGAEPVDRLLYAVSDPLGGARRDRIVTQGDLAFELDIDPHDQTPIVALDDPAYPREQRLVDLTVIRALAGDTVIYRPTADEVEARWQSVRATWARPEDFEAFLTRWGIDGDGLRGFLYSRMVAERYIRRVAGSVDTPVDSPEFTGIYQAWIAEVRGKVLIRRAP